MTENRRDTDRNQAHNLKLDQHSLPGSDVLEFQLIDTFDAYAPELCVHFLGPRNLDVWLHNVAAGHANCLTCERNLVLDRESQRDCRAVAVVPTEGTGKYVGGVCAGCFTTYGGRTETMRMVSERILSDLGRDGQFMTSAQYKAKMKRARRQAKRRHK